MTDEIKEELLSKQLKINFFNNIRDYERKNYLTTIEKFSDNFKLKRTTKQEEIDEVWILILPSFSSFFINKSYIKLDEMKLQGPTTLKIDLSKNKYIKLQNLGHGSSTYVSLIYHIELEQLFAIKTFVSSESEKLFSRENKNYKLLRHPSIPLFYGETEFNGHNKRIIMEYIRGSNLLNINSLSFEIEDKINIIFQMMLLIEFFRVSKFVYRDLKLNNFIIDQNKRLILVDFDRMINKDEKKLQMNQQ